MASVVGCAIGLIFAAVLGVSTNPAKMVSADHPLAYRLFPVLAVLLAAAVLAWTLRSRIVFRASLAGALLSLRRPEPTPGRIQYASLEDAAMASLQSVFVHSLNVATTLATPTSPIAILVTSKVLPAIWIHLRPRSTSADREPTSGAGLAAP